MLCDAPVGVSVGADEFLATGDFVRSGASPIVGETVGVEIVGARVGPVGATGIPKLEHSVGTPRH